MEAIKFEIEFRKNDLEARESEVVILNELQLALIGGGNGDVCLS